MTEESTNLGELFAALAKAQGQMKAADKDRSVGYAVKDGQGGYRDGGGVKYAYATLAEVWDSCRKPLSDNGLAVIQQVTAATDKTITVNSILGHASGQSVASELTMPVVGGTAQSVGSAITYARRYGLMALVGIVADEDDDGQAASGKGEKKPAPKPTEASSFAPAAKPGDTRTPQQIENGVAPLPAPKAAPLGADITPLNDWYIKPESRSAFWAAAKAAGHKTQEETLSVMGVTSMRLWTGTLEEAINKLQPKKPLAPFTGEDVEQEAML